MKITLNGIALAALLMAVVLMAYLFAASRTDPSLRIAALVAGTGLVASLASIASTLLTGKDVTAKQASDLPPNSSLSTTTTVNTTTPEVKP
jgi:hypothetical protein